MRLSPTAVFDCMIYAQALISPRGPAARCVEYVRQGGLLLVWSDYVLQEVRELPGKLPTKLRVTSDLVESFILDLAPHVEYVDSVGQDYVNPFDRDDSHYVNLAVAARAAFVVSRDGDLVRLMDVVRPEGMEFRRRFPDIQIVTPEELLALLANRS
jgi:putative PIN family toxin of toxin-antitoxin system